MNLDEQELPHIIVGALMEVHSQLGPGLALDAYKECLAYELGMREILFVRDQPGTVNYKGRELDAAFTMDFVVEDMVILHLYAAELEELHKKILKNHLRLSGLEIGFLVNFNAPELRKGGLKRLIVSTEEPALRWKEVDEKGDKRRK
ncbi:MAG: GxxExxY protein [Verrucomicrobiota bacterium]